MLGDEPTAVPVRATAALRPESESTVSHADRLPGVLGRNCTLITHVAPAGSDGGQFVDIGKSAVSVFARPMVCPVVVESVTVEVAAVSPTAVCGNVRVVALRLSAAVGPATSLLQAAQSTKSKGHVKTKSTYEDLDTLVARSRSRATRCSSKTPVVAASAFSEQDDSSMTVSESFDVGPCTFLRRATASVILSDEFFLR